MAANKKRQPSRDQKRKSRRGETTSSTRSKKICIVCGEWMEWIRGRKRSYWFCPNCKSEQ